MAPVRSANNALLCQTNNAFVTAREPAQGVQVAGGYAEFEGYQTWYRLLGDLDVGRADGPALLVTLHGGPGATHDYLPSMTDLARGRAGGGVLRPDRQRKSTHFPDRGADFYTVGLFARELDNLISHLGISDRYHVLGQSWGGMLAQEHAITPPGLRSVILSNTAASFAGPPRKQTRCGPPCRCRQPPRNPPASGPRTTPPGSRCPPFRPARRRINTHCHRAGLTTGGEFESGRSCRRPKREP